MKHKIPPPIVMLICAGLMFALNHIMPIVIDSDAMVFVSGSLVLVASIILLVSWLQFLKERTTVNPLQPHKATKLVVKGLYRYSRNPMYLGMACLLLAFSFYLENPLTLLGVAVFVVYINRFQILPEERAMESLFDASYKDYCKRVRRWI